MRNRYYSRSSISSFPSEFVEQVHLVGWIRLVFPTCLFSASAGGMRTSIGTAKKMKMMGYSKGTPDIAIYEPRKNYHGLFIELKREKNSVVTSEQKNWIDELNKRGYKALICKGHDEAVKEIASYLKE